MTIGRLRELELLGRVVAAAEGGAGGVALVDGEAGIGKTHLLSTLAGRTRGSSVVWGRAWEEGGAPPYWPWREVASAAALALDWEDTRDRFAVFEQVAAALRSTAEARPLLVLLDDLHAADPDTVALTRFIARSILNAPVAVVIAARPSVRLAALARDCVHVTLGPLSPVEISALAHETAPAPLSPRAREDIVRLAEGNPLVAYELALVGDRPADDSAGLPERLRDAVLVRVAELAATVREALDAAAVMGQEFDLGDIASVVGCSSDELLDRLGPAVEARIVARTTGTRWRFSHQVVRDALYQSIPMQARLGLHAAAARHIEEWARDQRLEEQARHLMAAVPVVDRDRALDSAQRAAAQASKSLAFGAAAGTLLPAVALAEGTPARLGLLLDLGDAQLLGGRVSEAWESFDEAGTIARALGDVDASTRALLGRTERVPSTSHAGELAGLVEHALDEHGPVQSATRIRLLARYASLQAAAGAMKAASSAASEALAAARSFDDDVLLSDVLTVTHITFRGPDDLETANDISDELVAVAARTGNPERILEAAMVQLVDQLRLGDIAGVDRTLERYRQLAASSRLPRYRFFAESRRATRAFLAGRLAEGEAMLDRAYRIGTDIEEPDTEYVYHGARVMVLSDLTDANSVRAEAEHAEAVAAATGETRLLVFAAFLRSSADEREVAAQLLDQAMAPDFSGVARDGSWLMFMCMGAYVIARAPDSDRARPLYDRLRPYAGQIVVNAGAVTFGGVVDHYLGLLAGALGDPDAAKSHLEDAIAIYQRLGATLFLARARQSRDELCAQPQAMPSPGPRRARLRRSRGEWECGFADSTFHLTHSVGLQHLARLIVADGAEIHVLELASTGAARAVALQSPQALLDPQAKAAYRERIADVRAELDEAENDNDFERASRLRAELDMIVEELRGAVGLGGRDRTTANHTERARVAVRKAITAALDRLAEHDSTFAQHLRIHVRTGIYCRYEPDPTNPIDWDAAP